MQKKESSCSIPKTLVKMIIRSKKKKTKSSCSCRGAVKSRSQVLIFQQQHCHTCWGNWLLLLQSEWSSGGRRNLKGTKFLSNQGCCWCQNGIITKSSFFPNTLSSKTRRCMTSKTNALLMHYFISSVVQNTIIQHKMFFIYNRCGASVALFSFWLDGHQ